MYIYFSSTNSVITCEEYPQLLSVEEMKLNELEYKCNKWEKKYNNDGTFKLYFTPFKHMCDFDNSQYNMLEDFDKYECYDCGVLKCEEEYDLYLQNSGTQDIVCARKNKTFCNLCEVPGYPNIYKWTDPDNSLIFALHCNDDNYLSDKNISENIDEIKDLCKISFVESL
jgi:hypothetical protein